MSPAHVHEPTYRRLKNNILTGGWPLGAKLEAARLADDYGVSMTPVRDSLNRLVGEGLVDLTPGEGFRVASMGEQRLRDILKVNLALLEYALVSSSAPAGTRASGPSEESYGRRIGSVFSAIAEGVRNNFLAETVMRISERLELVRELEPEIMPDALLLLSGMERSLRTDGPELQKAIGEYHDTCLRYVPQLVAGASSLN